MTPDIFNKAALDAKAITPAHITEMARYAQQALSITADGMCGPMTRAALDAEIAHRMITTAPLPTSFGAAIVKIAQLELGKGEIGGNNSGPNVQRYFLGTGMTTGEWCAAFVGYCYQEAHAINGWQRSVSALTMCDHLGVVGSMFQNPLLAVPGDLVAWRRGDDSAHTGHIAIIEQNDNGLLHTIEGNTGGYPSVVRRFVHDVRHERLYGIATLRKGIK